MTLRYASNEGFSILTSKSQQHESIVEKGAIKLKSFILQEQQEGKSIKLIGTTKNDTRFLTERLKR